MRESGRKILAAASARAKALGVTATERLIDDRPVDAVTDAIGQNNATLLVVGTHGRHGLGRLLLGSVAEGVLRQSTVPVLVTKG
jgi:nucleotide-binding universal stress UspA family protein